MHILSLDRATWCAGLALLGIALLLPQQAHAQLGVTAGFNFEQTEDIQSAAQGASKDAVLNNATGYHVGVVWQLGSGTWSVRPGVIFRQVGTYEFSEIQENFDVQVIEVPFDIRVRLLNISGFEPYAVVGPKASFPRSEGDFDEGMESISLSGAVGGGININPSWLPITLQPEFRYAYGVTRFIEDDFTVAGQTFDPQDEPRLSAFSIRLHLLF